MCRPVGVSGRTHRSAPTRWGRRSEPTENWCEDGPCQRGGTEPAPYGGPEQGGASRTAGCTWGVASTSQIPKRNLGRQSWTPRPTGAMQVVPSEGPMWSSAPTGRRVSFSNHPGQRRRAERLRRGCEKMGGNCGRDHPQRGHQPRTIPQSRLRRASSLYTRELFPAGDGGCGLPRRFAPRNDSPKPLSFRGGPTGRRGNPSFLRWTGVRAAVPRAWPPPRLPGQRLAKRKARR